VPQQVRKRPRALALDLRFRQEIAAAGGAASLELVAALFAEARPALDHERVQHVGEPLQLEYLGVHFAIG